MFARHLPVDAAAFLGARDPLRRRLQGRRRADAAGGGRLASTAADRILGYTVALVGASLLLVPVADMGWIYGLTAAAAGAGFVAMALGLRATPTAAKAMRLFTYSISYVTVLFAAMAVDVLVR